MPLSPEKHSLKIVVLIKTNPFESPRGVEAIRMALGLGSGVHQVEIILMGDAPYLLTEEQERILDYETLEKYISSFEDSEKPFYIEEAFLKNHPDFETVYPYASTTTEIIADKISAGEKFLIF